VRQTQPTDADSAQKSPRLSSIISCSGNRVEVVGIELWSSLWLGNVTS
jgi:hypothetical protein